MKKKLLLRLLEENRLTKLSRIMRISIFLMIVGIFQVNASSVYSQNEKFSFNEQEQTMRGVLKSIEKQSNFRFFFNDVLTNADKKVALVGKDMKIDQVLNSLLTGTNLSYKILEKHLVIISPKTLLQQQQITGVITDASTKEPLIGVNVVLEGTTVGTVTDVNGKYVISVPDGNGTLVFSYIGYNNEKVSISGKSSINVNLISDIKALSEVVVIGYGSQKKTDLTGAISTISVKDIKDVPATNLTTALSGRLAGVTIQQNGGGPTAGLAIRIRGTGTINNNNPLVVIDGMIGADLNNVSPNDIESMSVLKDAAAAAIYGSRAASGVIIVTTKRGKVGEAMHVNFDSYFGFQETTKKLNVLSASQLATIYNEASTNDGSIPLPEFTNPSSMNDVTNWQNEVFRKAVIQNYALSINGGGEKSSYSMSFNMKDNQGILVNTFNKQYTFRINSDHQIGKRIKVGESLALTYKNYKAANTKDDNSGAILMTLAMHPDVPVYNEDGTYHGVLSSNYGDVENPLGLLKRNDGYNRAYQLESNVYAQYKIIDGLYVKTSYSLGYLATDDKAFNPIKPEAGRPSYVNSLSQKREYTPNWLWENTINYDKVLGDHKISFVTGVTSQHSEASDMTSRRVGYSIEDPSVWYLSSGATSAYANGQLTEFGIVSYLGRLSYIYADKYLFGATVRADGSSRFTKENRWGYFPALSAAWRVSQESFLKDLAWINDLKLRTSWGILGNQDVGLYKTYGTYNITNANANYFLGSSGNNTQIGYYMGTTANKDLKWESTRQFNVGLDAAFLDNKVSFTFDYFNKLTSDMLVYPTILGDHGTNSPPWVNAGSVSNKGIEAVVSYRNSTNSNPDQFTYEVTGNFTKYVNNVESLGNNNQPMTGPNFRDSYPITITQPGSPISSFYGYKTDGIFKTDAEVSSYKNSKGELLQPSAMAGDLKFVDINGDGEISSSDRTVLGSSTPDFTYGLNLSAWYKGFDFSMLFQGEQGQENWYALRYQLGFTGLKYNYLSEIMDRWTPSNSNASRPRVTWADPNNNKRPSDYFIEDGSFLKLKNITLGYTLPTSLTKKYNVEKLRVYVSAQNLLTFTKYPGYDPELGLYGGSSDLESGVDRGQYPQSRSLFFGVNVSF